MSCLTASPWVRASPTGRMTAAALAVDVVALAGDPHAPILGPELGTHVAPRGAPAPEAVLPLIAQATPPVDVAPERIGPVPIGEADGGITQGTHGPIIGPLPADPIAGAGNVVVE